MNLQYMKFNIAEQRSVCTMSLDGERLIARFDKTRKAEA